MKKLLISLILFASATANAMELDETARSYIASVRAQFPTLYPMAKTDDEGFVEAYYSKNEESARVIVERKNGIYERHYLRKNKAPEITTITIHDPRNLQDFERRIITFYLSNGTMIKLPLNQTS